MKSSGGSCPVELLSAMLDGELDERSAAEVRAHAESCARCAGIVEDLRRVSGLLRDERVPDVPAGLARRIQTGVRSGRRGPSLLALARSRPLAVAASVLLFVTAAFLLRGQLVERPRLEPPPHEAARDEASTTGSLGEEDGSGAAAPALERAEPSRPLGLAVDASAAREEKRARAETVTDDAPAVSGASREDTAASEDAWREQAGRRLKKEGAGKGPPPAVAAGAPNGEKKETEARRAEAAHESRAASVIEDALGAGPACERIAAASGLPAAWPVTSLGGAVDALRPLLEEFGAAARPVEPDGGGVRILVPASRWPEFRQRWSELHEELGELPPLDARTLAAAECVEFSIIETIEHDPSD